MGVGVAATVTRGAAEALECPCGQRRAMDGAAVQAVVGGGVGRVVGRVVGGGSRLLRVGGRNQPSRRGPIQHPK